MAFDKDAFLTALDSMTVMELNDLVKAIEEKFGVSAAAMAAPAAAGGGAAAAAEEKTDFNVVLLEAGAKKPKTWSTALQRLSRKLCLRQTPKPPRRSWKKLAPRPNSSNSVSFQGWSVRKGLQPLALEERTEKWICQSLLSSVF
jgi:Ribosomal protein L7/L12 dimerisation domain